MADLGPDTPETCGDPFNPRGSSTVYRCTREPGHEYLPGEAGLHYNDRLGYNWAINICEATTTSIGLGRPFRCCLPIGHAGLHDNTAAVTWDRASSDPEPDENAPVRCGPECTEGHTYRIGTCERAPACQQALEQLVPPVFIPGSRCGYKIDRGIYHVTVTTDAGSIHFKTDTYDSIDDATFEAFIAAWSAGDYARCRDLLGEADPRDGLKHLAEANDREKTRIAAEDARMDRDRAIEHAIRALEPVAGAFDLPGLEVSGVRADYGDAIITLAEQLGHYIQNGRG